MHAVLTPRYANALARSVMSYGLLAIAIAALPVESLPYGSTNDLRVALY